MSRPIYSIKRVAECKFQSTRDWQPSCFLFLGWLLVPPSARAHWTGGRPDAALRWPRPPTATRHTVRQPVDRDARLISADSSRVALPILLLAFCLVQEEWPKQQSWTQVIYSHSSIIYTRRSLAPRVRRFFACSLLFLAAHSLASRKKFRRPRARVTAQVCEWVNVHLGWRPIRIFATRDWFTVSWQILLHFFWYRSWCVFWGLFWIAGLEIALCMIGWSLLAISVGGRMGNLISAWCNLLLRQIDASF